VQFVPRFVSSDNYASSFGFQWNLFGRTQLDSHTGLPISRDRLFESTGWDPADLDGKTVLDIGCGAGRFTEIVLSAGAEVIAVDSSTAVDACRQNFVPHPRLNVVQADIHHLPFQGESFDFLYCFGVLQHTPDVRRAFLSLSGMLRKGGRLAVDVYPKLWLNALWPRYWLRPLTCRMSHSRLLGLVRWMVAILLPVSLAVGRLPRVGRRLRHVIPVANREPDFPLSPDHLKEWAVLDTYDMLAAAYDQPQSAQTLAEWFEQAGLRESEVFRRGPLVGRGVK